MFSIFRAVYGEPAEEAVETEHLEFLGRDAAECETFINAVSRRALAEGKQRDDQWIAEFAASCFTQGALRWCDGLDEQTQCSWKLLRKAMLSRYRPIFYGRSGEEAEEFVRMVHDRAIDANMVRSDGWYTSFFGSSLAGDALRWYASLELEVQKDWNRLQQAVFARYPPQSSVPASLDTIPVPAPAAAAPPPATTVRRRARIRVVSEGSHNTYVSKKFNRGGFVAHTDDPSCFLQVEYIPSFITGTQALYIPDNQIEGCDLFGIKWILNTSKATLCATNSNDAEGTSNGVRDSLLRRAWRISPQPSDPNGVELVGLSAMSGSEQLYAHSSGDWHGAIAFFGYQSASLKVQC
ncbi:hypothetical protein FRC05_002000 [Tulasnella sp. 425]|nr:hypothetical protein FRC05_002000 [Tulasnella sp. 425]